MTAKIPEGEGYLFSEDAETMSPADVSWVLDPEGYEDMTSHGETLECNYKSETGTYSRSFEGPDGETREVEVEEKHIAIFDPAEADIYEEFAWMEAEFGNEMVTHDALPAGYRLLVTSEKDMPDEYICGAYL
ncbi:MAG: hypothetical protein LUB61_07845, partial [Eggerthellaceae bacterium]|nr:hypothetical protein [Eggerthellaceae bacterium]